MARLEGVLLRKAVAPLRYAIVGHKS